MKQTLYIYCIIAHLVLSTAGSVFAHSSGRVAQSPAHTAADLLYSMYQDNDFWTGEGEKLRVAILRLADSVSCYGLRREDYKFPTVTDAATDELFTRTAASLLADLHRGRVKNLVSNDEVEHAFRGRTDSVIALWLLRARTSGAEVAALIPPHSHYALLGKLLAKHIQAGHADTVRQLAATANLYRWIAHFGFSKYIVVNIPAAMLKYYEHDIAVLSMKVIVGKPSTRTPRFSSWLDKVILYPYWNVPASIATKELLPIFRRSPSKVAEMNMQLLDNRGRIVDHNSLNWQSFHPGYFPYTIRQCTGCDNALGVMKFNLTDPFSVYMHDTNNKPAFMSDHRYLSHGCIRLSDPVALGNALLNNSLDTAFLAACFRNEKPQVLPLPEPVPVFVVYMTADVAADSVIYYRDVYNLR